MDNDSEVTFVIVEKPKTDDKGDIYHARQYIFFPYKFRKYIYKKSNPFVKAKLYETCKLFALDNDIHCYDQILDNLAISFELANIVIEDKAIWCQALSDLNGKAIWVRETFYIDVEFDKDSLSAIIRGCTAKDISIHSNISMKDFELLTAFHFVNILIVCVVIDQDGNAFSVEDIISAVPNATDITINKCRITPTTDEWITKRKRVKEIKQLILRFSEVQRLNDYLIY